MSEVTLTLNTLSEFILACNPDPTDGYSVPQFRNTTVTLNLVAPHLEIFDVDWFLHQGLRDYELDGLHRYSAIVNAYEDELSTGAVVEIEDEELEDEEPWVRHWHIENGILHAQYTIDPDWEEDFLETFLKYDYPIWTAVQLSMAARLGLAGITQTWVLDFKDEVERFGESLGYFQDLLGSPCSLPFGTDGLNMLDDDEGWYGARGTILEGIHCLRNLPYYQEELSDMEGRSVSAEETWLRACSHTFTPGSHLNKVMSWVVQDTERKVR